MALTPPSFQLASFADLEKASDGIVRWIWRGYPSYYGGGGYSYPSYSDYSSYSTGNLDYYYPSSPAVDTSAPVDVIPPGQARIRVIVPAADAHVWLNDALMTTPGMERVYQTPPLDPNGKYTYTIGVRWTENGQEVEQVREVPVQVGQESVANFVQPQAAPKRATPPPPQPRPGA